MIPAASIDTSVTSASPIISADAVEAVRCGLRWAFSRARLPAVPPIFVAGQPSAVASGVTSLTRQKCDAEEDEQCAAEHEEQDAPPCRGRGAKRPQSSPPKPSTASSDRRREPEPREADSGSWAPSRTAAIGGTRVARSAGRRLASSVTRTPTTSETTTVRGLESQAVVRQREADRVEERESPLARAEPDEEPDDAARTPITSASMMIERSSWRRDAPSVRSVASSRVRCAIVIESEFAITKLPTKSATPPNPSRNFWRKEMNEFVSLLSSWACARRSAPGVRRGGWRWICRSSWSVETFGFGRDRDLVELPGLAEERCAVGRSKPASVAPPIVATEPNFTIPDTRSC